ncbi:hypothetical protein GS429_02665 [Natronorubrum sp. JWXQ-INN-674]|uniref:Uncharacterized protein n=1 Tax=Natronorubrum halalkaliphilum TaxID=2691917 RepID=A0A6B0VHE9_9EURY|nr:hypothetical protein [Natronorubrum halalkaliphilum]MXV60978.1 hypothetical protein [Natronorubrum halalkaliphilum]
MSDSGINRRDLLKTTAVTTTVTSSGLAVGAVSADGKGRSLTASNGELDVTVISADSDAGFNYPYYLYAPATVDEYDRPLLVEPNNTGGTSDSLEDHREAAESLIERQTPRQIADELRVPVLVPVFPRPASDPVDGYHYVHALDVETMQIDGGKLERVDQQLLHMIEHAKAKLADRSYPVADGILMNGFSASGNFVNRFTALHPEIVRSATAGGINGTALLPETEANGHQLNYQVGVADLVSLTGHEFDLEGWQETDQLVYMAGMTRTIRSRTTMPGIHHSARLR